jgi:hypothetical protein
VIIERPILIQVPVEVFIDRVVYKEVPVVVENIVEVEMIVKVPEYIEKIIEKAV